MRAARLLLAAAVAATAAAAAAEVPVVLSCGYVGGTATDEVRAAAADAAGHTYLAGSTASSETSFPAAVGPDGSYNGGFVDSFVAKVAADGSALVYAGYLGGAAEDVAAAIAVDALGAAYVVGSTTSSEATFPVVGGPDLTHNSAGPSLQNDAFVAKVSPDGAALAYCGYVGGASEDAGRAVAVDSGGAAYVGGHAGSTEATFPVRGGPMLRHLAPAGAAAGFVARVSADGSMLAYCGYVGGAEGGAVHAIAVDDGGSGGALVSGATASTAATFPVLIGPDLSENGGEDAFVASVLPDGSGFAYAGFLGGGDGEDGYGIAVDPAGRAVVTGFTRSTEATFPVAVGPDPSANAGMDGFVARVRADGAGLEACGFLGGSLDDWPRAVAVDAAGRPVVVGSTSSREATFPVIDGPDLTYNGTGDAFVARLAADFTALDSCGYLGGSRQENAFGIAVGASGDLHLAGYTESSQASFPVLVGPDLIFNSGTRDGWIAHIAYPGACATAAAEIRRLLATKAGPDVALGWSPDPAANGYNLWRVRDKTAIDRARQASAPPAEPVPGCAFPTPTSLTLCSDPTAVDAAAGSPLFYQVRSFCDAASEGP